MIEKLKPTDDEEYCWIDDDGISYRSKTEYLENTIVGFCYLEYIRDFLIRLKNHEWGTYEDMPYMFLCHWSDAHEFSEYGTTIRCSWLTDKGKELLSDIVWCIENEDTI